MQSPYTQKLSFSRIGQFLEAVDGISKLFGKNIPPIVEIEKLRKLPPDTLGRAWADLLDRNHLLPFSTGPRRKQLHDGIHVLTGYGTDPVGEAEVQAFLLGAKFGLAHIILLLGLLRSMKGQHWNRLLRKKLHQAYERGSQSCFDIDGWKPEQMWEWPLAKVQRIFGISAIEREIL
jgi:ubiquinone biosynthesis protein Coq4